MFFPAPHSVGIFDIFSNAQIRANVLFMYYCYLDKVAIVIVLQSERTYANYLADIVFISTQFFFYTRFLKK